MRPLTDKQARLLDAVRMHGEVSVWGFGTDPEHALSTARSLEKRGLVVIGYTDHRSVLGRLYLVSATTAGKKW